MPGTQRVQVVKTWSKREQLLALFAVLAVLASLTTFTLSVNRPLGATTLSTARVVELIPEDTTDPVELDELAADVLAGTADISDGTGIDVAIIDTGVAAVDGLDADGKVLHGPDLTTEAATDLATVDSYGHGTHMAGIIAGERDGAEGIAPGARIVSVKVAGADGETSLPQLIGAIDWVVANKNSDGLDIRVLNLSFGHGEIDTHVGDPLSAAVERAWDAGIVVVVAAGNDAEEHGHLGSPAVDPFVLAVGSTDSTGGEAAADQPVADFSSIGDGVRNPDVVAPGRSIASYRVPGSTIVDESPEGLHGDDLFRGSGTSQSAAVVSGLVARLLGEHPTLTPDQVKATLARTATALDAPAEAAGAGRVDLAAAAAAPAFDAEPQDHARALTDGAPMLLWPEGDWNGAVWGSATWASATWAGAVWAGANWAGANWAGANWAGANWAGANWAGANWAGANWAGANWAGANWAGANWAGANWAGANWAGANWAGANWAGANWAGANWAGATWAGATWAGANWAGANWAGANWAGANWAGANWAGANWAGANWAGANWAGANWAGANWAGANWA